ncbi:Zn-ribbon domain-containing OB-fold protein [Pseudofrankia asymbiotica]|uniref:Zn-ribbon domain-containing OB-fold protein n=1 Tax=Pseudofrankia asymbiotica TaxID=1834516 RepID=UPI000975FE04|nr:zinc ribbon domain-containing protein [Pseudofrankia asymbiotica]
MSDAVNRPAGMPDPVVAPINEGMWRAAAAGRLDVQRCASCGAHRYPPIDGCYRCGSVEWDWSTLPGTGTVYSYIWVPDRTRPGTPEAPALYNVAVVTLEGAEGDPVRILSNVIDAWSLEDLHVGDRVAFAPVGFGGADGAGDGAGVGVGDKDDLALPCFRMLP